MQNPLRWTQSQTSREQGCRRGVPTTERDPAHFQISACLCADSTGAEHTPTGAAITELSYICSNVFEATGAKLLNGSAFPLKEKFRCSHHFSLDDWVQRRLVGLQFTNQQQDSQIVTHNSASIPLQVTPFLSPSFCVCRSFNSRREDGKYRNKRKFWIGWAQSWRKRVFLRLLIQYLCTETRPQISI